MVQYKYLQRMFSISIDGFTFYRCRRGLIYVASISQVWRIDAVDITKQRQMLLKDKYFQLALNLTVNIYIW